MLNMSLNIEINQKYSHFHEYSDYQQSEPKNEMNHSSKKNSSTKLEFSIET